MIMALFIVMDGHAQPRLPVMLSLTAYTVWPGRRIRDTDFAQGRTPVRRLVYAFLMRHRALFIIITYPLHQPIQASEELLVLCAGLWSIPAGVLFSTSSSKFYYTLSFHLTGGSGFTEACPFLEIVLLY
jgi:hypothetical protein